MYLLNNLIIGLLIRGVWGQTVVVPPDPSLKIDLAPPTVVGQPEQPTAPSAPEAPEAPTAPEVLTAPEAPTTPTPPTESTDGIQSNTATEPVDPTASTDASELTEPSASNEATQPTEPIEPTALTEPTDLIEPTLPTAPTEATESIIIPPVEPTDPTAQDESIGPTVIVEPTEQSEAAGPTASEPSPPTDPTASAESVPLSEPTEATEAVEPTEATEAVEPTEATEAVEPTEATEAVEPTEATQQSEASEAAIPTETTQPALAEPTEPTESAEQPEATAPPAPTAEAPEVSGGPEKSGEGLTAGPASTQGPDIRTDEPVDQPEQTEAAPSGFTTLTTPPPEPTGDVAELDLGDASLNPNARFTTVAGEEAIVLEPPPNGEATFSVKVEEPLDIEEGNLVELEAVVQVVESSSNRRKRFLIGRQDRGNRLQMIMNEKIIYDKEVDEAAGKFQRIKSEKTQFVKNPVVQVLQTSGDNPVALSVSGLGFVKSETPTKEPNKPVVIPNTEPDPGSQKTEEPAKEPPAPPEATGEQPAPDNQETDEPAPEPAAPPKVSVEEPPLVGEETTVQVQPPQQTSPPDVVETEPVPGTLEAAAPSEPARSDGGTIITEQRPESRTGIAPVIITGNPPETVPATPTGPVEVRPNKAAHRIVTSMVVLYGVPVLAALLV